MQKLERNIRFGSSSTLSYPFRWCNHSNQQIDSYTLIWTLLQLCIQNIALDWKITHFKCIILPPSFVPMILLVLTFKAVWQSKSSSSLWNVCLYLWVDVISNQERDTTYLARQKEHIINVRKSCRFILPLFEVKCLKYQRIEFEPK